MLKAPSLQHRYTLVFSEDPALDLPVVPELAHDATQEQRDEAEKLEKEREHKLKVARETGRWDDLCRPGMEPTLFTFEPITGTTLTWLQGEARRRNLGNEEGIELAFRLSLRDVTNLGKFKVDDVVEDGRRLATAATIDALYALGREAGDATLGRRLIIELGVVVYARAVAGLSPP